MKFFTMEWWGGEADTDPSPGYRARLAEIQDKVPPGLWWLQHWSRLHDAQVQKIRFDADSKSLLIELVGSSDLLSSTSVARKFNLHYQQVVEWTSFESEFMLPGPKGYGDLGYDEVDVDPQGLLEHRLLFSTGIEICIKFKDFFLEWTDDDQTVNRC